MINIFWICITKFCSHISKNLPVPYSFTCISAIPNICFTNFQLIFWNTTTPNNIRNNNILIIFWKYFWTTIYVIFIFKWLSVFPKFKNIIISFFFILNKLLFNFHYCFFVFHLVQYLPLQFHTES